MKKQLSTIAAGLVIAAISGCVKQAEQPAATESTPTPGKHVNNNIDIWPTLDIAVKQDPEVEKQVKQLLAEMTIEQKVAQIIQPEIRDFTVEDMRKYGFGSFLNGGGAFPDNDKHSTPQDWIKLAEDMYQASIDDSLDGSSIPTMWGTDAVHGHNNVVGATLFPHNIGLGAANNPDLIEKIANITATEVMVTGIDWVFAPTVATVRDDRWGRTYEGYSEDPEIVKAYSEAIVKGLQGHADKDFLSDNRVISTVKHFLGDGGTVKGDDQGNNIDSEQDLFDLHAQGYVGGLTVGAQSVMASFNSWHGKKMHGYEYFLTDVLKDKMGFDGFVVGDWNGHGQVAGCDNTSCPQAINAGLDIFMVPTDWKALYENTLKQAKEGIISMERLDDAVTRVLRVKVRAGIFNKPSPANRQFSGKTELIGAPDHREVARQAVRESLVLLKNKGGILPLDPKLNILVAGDAAHNIGKQSGGWTITWQGTNNVNEDFPGGQSIFDGLRDQVEASGGNVTLSENGKFDEKPDVAIVVFGEEPYAEGNGDVESLEYQKGDKSDLALLNKLKEQGIPVVSIFISGRPMWVNAELNASDAFVAAWLPGSEGAGVADVLLANAQGEVKYDFAGKLSFSWPDHPTQIVNRHDADYQPLLPYGFGLTYGDENVLADDLPQEVKQDSNMIAGLTVFEGNVKKPWKMQLYSQSEIIDVSANTHQLASLSYRTIDRVVQEDAWQLKFLGKGEAGVRFTAEQPVDLSSAITADTSLELSIKLLQKPSGEVNMKTACISSQGKCETSVNVTSALNNLSTDSWQQFTVASECFDKETMMFDATSSPFELSTGGELELAISGIKFVSVQSKPDISCR